MLKLYDLRCDYLSNTIGIGDRHPEFSWKIKSDRMNVLQIKYRIQTASNDNFANIIWDSGIVCSDQSAHVYYSGPDIESRKRYYFRVMIEDNTGDRTDWSAPSFFETGILDSAEWKACFISADKDEHPAYSSAVQYFRKEFDAHGQIRSARIYATAFGLYEIRLNGKRIGEYYLTPGWTSYHKRLQYQTYDITPLLRIGTNAIGALVGNGWYKGLVVHSTEKYGSRLALLAEIHIEYQGGSSRVIITDDSWKTSRGPILSSEIYAGETYDATKEQSGWDCAGYDDGKWRPAVKIAADKRILVAQEDIPAMKQETLHPVKIIAAPNGDHILDFGQNMVGWVRFKVSGEKGSKVILNHGEVLDKSGNFYTDNLRAAKQTIEYTLKGEGIETYEPHFTYQGFRYVRVVKYPGKIDLKNFVGVVLHSEMKATGDFSCSEDMVNKLQHNIRWGQKGNFVDVPTDCPQRDERLGWTGDAQVFASTACFNMDCVLFFKKWLHDLQSDQLPDGQVPDVVPHVLRDDEYSSSGWGDAAVICPWTVYLYYGDKRILSEQYPSMKAWVEYIRSQTHSNIWDTGTHYGDWLALDRNTRVLFGETGEQKNAGEDYYGATPNDYVSTAFYAYSTSLLAKAAGALGNKKDEAEYQSLFENIARSFQNEYFTPTGRLSIHTQTACVLALMFDLIKKKDKKRTADLLVSMLKESKWHLTTGFLGTPYICHALSKSGHADVAYRLLLQTDYPSWLYQITKGATTIWEHWDGIKPDGSFWSPDMNSFNHYAYGSIGSWLYEVVCGIQPDEHNTGYKKVIFRPIPSEKIGSAKAVHESLYGVIASEWNISDEALTVSVKIPHNSRGKVYLPYTNGENIVLNSKRRDVKTVGDIAEVELGSGDWSFSYPIVK